MAASVCSGLGSTVRTFGTIIADPPWNYGKQTKRSRDVGRSRRGSDGKSYYMSGYSDDEYEPLTTEDLCELPVYRLVNDKSVLLLWATLPFVPDALAVMAAWGFKYVTAIPWVKIDGVIPPKPVYGVGYWFRGAAELILVGKRKCSYRSNYVGFMSESFEHSRKPDDLHAVAEELYPGPYLELFARRVRAGWTQVGKELPGLYGEDIRDSLKKLIEGEDTYA